MISMKLRRNDIILAAGVLLLALAFAGLYHLIYQDEGDTVQITIDGTDAASLPLDTDTRYTIASPDGGKNILEISGGAARIIEANCPDKLCVHQKEISCEGESLICLPHKVTVSIRSTSKKATLDGVAQ